MKVWHLALAALVCATTIGARAEHIVEIRLHGRYYTEPATIRVTVAVQPDQANRTLVVQADSEKLFRSSDVTLEGENGQRLHTVEFKNLPAGSYVLRAEVHSSAKLRGAAEELLVVGDTAHSR
jgi:hypothetical protein